MSRLPVVPGQECDRGRRLPPWLKRPLPVGGQLAATRRIVGASGVATVCEQARCPNLSECWSRKTATFMILGDRCTRRCQFCAVNTARPRPPEPGEPERLAEAVAELGLRHVVITAVARDDLADQGAGQFAACVRAVRRRVPGVSIEVLPADLGGRRECIATICEAGPDVFNHNLETVERLTPVVRPQAKYKRSLDVLRIAKELRPGMPTKSGLMVGLGETRDEIRGAMADLRSAGCDILTMGQYLQPTSTHVPVARFYTPAEFEELAAEADAAGFVGVAAGPLVRSSYNAGAVYDRVRERQRAGCGG